MINVTLRATEQWYIPKVEALWKTHHPFFLHYVPVPGGTIPSAQSTFYPLCEVDQNIHSYKERDLMERPDLVWLSGWLTTGQSPVETAQFLPSIWHRIFPRISGQSIHVGRIWFSQYLYTFTPKNLDTIPQNTLTVLIKDRQGAHGKMETLAGVQRDLNFLARLLDTKDKPITFNTPEMGDPFSIA